MAQGVFYSFFYAFPKSRLQFDDEYKKFVFQVFAELFTGLKISHKSQFVKGWTFVTNWKLDLGAGDVLQQSKAQKLTVVTFLVQRDSEKTSLPEIGKRNFQQELRKKKEVQQANKLLRDKGERPNVSAILPDPSK